MRKSEICNAVLELMQDQSAVARQLVNRWVNIVLGDIASHGYLKSLQREEATALVQGSGSDMSTGRNYDLAPNTDKVFKVFIPALGRDGILKKLNGDDFLERMLQDGATVVGQPRYYTIFGNLTLRIHPIPSAQFAPASPTDVQKLWIWKYRDIEDIGDNDEITEITAKARNMLMMGCYALGARFDSFGDYQSSMAEYERALNKYFFQQAVDFDRPPQVQYRDL